MNIIILGANGLIGSTVFRVLSKQSDYIVHGTVRHEINRSIFPSELQKNIITNVDVLDDNALADVLIEYRPNVVINCAGLTKHRPNSESPLLVLPINSLFPHKLVKLSSLVGARVIHISTDCVFSGSKGSYSEHDHPDALELYGISKSLGEVDYSNAITIRTSTLGHEKECTTGLLEWFLHQTSSCKGFEKTIFSGLPTVTLAEIIRDYVLIDEKLTGLYHISAEPIDKLSLLRLIAHTYDKTIRIVADDSLVIDRSLSAKKFYLATGYTAPPWDVLVRNMHEDFERSSRS
tara:strand:+ start:337 stop:1209 length:873 start_codon:yes stop_codon:yes gene_type:complete